jgi:hypothetical protein
MCVVTFMLLLFYPSGESLHYPFGKKELDIMAKSQVPALAGN